MTVRLVGVALLALGASCGGDADHRAATVLVASSLGPAFEELAAAYEQAHPEDEVELHAAGSPTLLVQLREGLPANVFAPADRLHVEAARALSHGASEPQPFASNRLALAVPRGNPADVQSLADLARPDVVTLLCGPEVPAGRAARALLREAGVTVTSASDEPSVQAVVTRLVLGEVDAGLVYATDVRRTPELVEVPLEPAPPLSIDYSLVLLDEEHGRTTALRFAAFVSTPEGQRILARHGFEGPLP